MPADRQAIIRNAVQKARIDWFQYTINQEKAIYKLCENAAAQIEARIYRAAKEGKIPPQRLIWLLGSRINPNPDSIRGILVQLRPKLRSEVKKGITQSVTFGMKSQIHGLVDTKLPPRVKLGVGTSFIGKDGKIRTYDVTKGLYAKSTWAKINSDAVDFLMRTQYAGITFSDRVWDITWDAEKQIRSRVNTAVLTGDGVDKVAREIKPYLIRPDDRFHRIRKDGKLVLSKPAKAYRPGRGVYRSSFQRARRLARTEMHRAYHEGQIRYMQQKSWIDGAIWVVGGANPCDICSDLDGRFFKKDEIPGQPHPNCMCDLQTHIEYDPMPKEKPEMLPDTKKSILTSY